MGRLAISGSLLSGVERHARATYPEECCGILLGHTAVIGGTERTRVSSVVPAENVHDEPKARRYAIAPELLLGTHKEARRGDQEVVGYYHSHPDREALPSDTDLATAIEGVSYLIVSVVRGRVRERRAWRLRPDGSGFEEEELE